MKTIIDWTKVFKTKYPVAGISDEELAVSIAALSTSLSEEELAGIASSQTNPFPPGDPLHRQYRPFDPGLWRLPNKPLPPSYLNFLRWSNGGSFFNDDRHFDPFLGCGDLRKYLVGYHIPQYMPETVPFALSGTGHVYLFDMRNKPSKGEYPILFASLGSLRFQQSVEVGKSFPDVCSGDTNPMDGM